MCQHSQLNHRLSAAGSGLNRSKLARENVRLEDVWVVALRDLHCCSHSRRRQQFVSMQMMHRCTSMSTTCFHAYTSAGSSRKRCHLGGKSQSQNVSGKPQIKAAWIQSVDQKGLIITTGAVLDWLPWGTITILSKLNSCMAVQVLHLVKF